MYQIMKDGKTVDYADKVLFIRMQDNGSYGGCSFSDCTGFAANGIPYHLDGRPTTGMEDLPTASYMVIDAAKTLAMQEERIAAAEGAILSVMLGGSANV